MGSGLGPGWRDAGGGEVSLAAFPTGVDRSARVVADGKTPARTCRAIGAGARAVEVDVFLEPLVPLAARVVVNDAAGGAVMTIELSRSRTVVSIGAEVNEGAGVTPAKWLHVEMRSADGGVAWEVSERDGGSEPSAQGRTEGIATEGLTEICLEVEAIPGGTAYYDNLAVEWTNGEGG